MPRWLQITFRILGGIITAFGLIMLLGKAGSFSWAFLIIGLFLVGISFVRSSTTMSEQMHDMAEKTQQGIAAAQQAKADTKQRITENHANGLACCPRCGSTSLTANKKGFGAGKAVVGALVVGNVLGAAAGGIGSGKVTVTCLNCGYKFKPGQK